MGTKIETDDLTNIISLSAIEVINNNFEDLSDEFDKVVYRDGSLNMLGNLDMNSKRIYNLLDAASNTEPITKGQLGPIISTAIAGVAQGIQGPPGAGVNSPTGLVGNGTADDRGTIAAYDTALGTGKEFWLTAGTYRISSNLTINNLVRFMKGAIIKPDAGATVTLSGGFVFADQFTQHFNISNSNSHVWALKGRVTQWTYGALGRAVTADDSVYFQAAIDNQIYYQGASFLPAEGSHKTAYPLIFNYGNGTFGNYRSVDFIGPGAPYNGGAGQFGGLAIEYTGFESAIEVQGCRAMRFEGFSLIGPFITMFNSTLFGNGGSIPSLDPNIMSNWIPAGANPLCMSRYKMSTGIHVDSRCGAKPTAPAWAASTAYNFGMSVTNGGNLYVQYQFGAALQSASSGGPTGTGSTQIADNQCSWMYAGPASTSIAYTDYTYPSWAGVPDQYNKGLSSECTFRNVSINGFACGVGVKGCNSSSNADFMHIDKCQLFYNVFPFLWGNNQARLNSVVDTNLALCHTCVSPAIIGQQTGESHINMVNCQIGNSSRVIYFPSTGIGASVNLDNCYGEVVNIIGDCASTGPSGTSLNIRGGSYNFANQIWWLKPAYMVNVTSCNLTMDGVSLSLMGTPFIIKGDPNLCNLKLDIANTMWMTGAANPSAITQAEAIMMRSTGDVMFLALNQGPWTGSVRNSSQYGLTGSGRGVIYGTPTVITDSTNLIPFCANRVSPSASIDPESRSISLGGYQRNFNQASVSSYSRTGDVATLTLTAAPTMANALNEGTHTGGIIYHDDSKTLFCVESRTGAVLTLRALNNMIYTTGAPIVTIDAAGTGNWYSVPTGHYMPNSNYNLTYTAGSPTVTMARNDTNTTGSGALFLANSAIATNDITSQNAPVLRPNSLISSAVDGTITLGGNARLSVTKSMPLLIYPR